MSLYQVLRPLVAACTRQFFREIRLVGVLPDTSSPLLILPNHPNFALDSLLVLSVFKRPLWFLAKGTLFANPLLRRIFSALHMVPVYRRQDDPAQVAKNDETFRVASETLLRGDAIVMFPEGKSMGERKLYPVKTGAARIALLAESLRGFSAGLVIQPVGLTYRSFGSFQSDVTVTLAAPIAVGEYRERYAHDPSSAVQALTERIETALRDSTVDLKSLEHTGLVEKLTALFQSAYPERSDHDLMKSIAENVELLAPQFPDRKRALEERIDAFLSLLAVFRLSAKDLSDARRDWIFLLLLSPFVLLGAALYAPPYWLVRWMVPRLVTHPVEEASFKLGLGIVFFSGWLVLAMAAMLTLGVGGWMGMLLCIGMLLLGIAVNRYLSAVRLAMISLLWPGRQKPFEVLQLLRNQLVSELAALRVR